MAELNDWQTELDKANVSLANAQAIRHLVDSGFTCKKAAEAVAAGDIRLLTNEA